VRTLTISIAIGALLCASESAAFAQGMLVASIGKVYGGSAQISSGTWAVAIGGGGAHGIGSELEFSRISRFTDRTGQDSSIYTLMPGVFLTLPIHAVRPYGIFGFGFIRQRTVASTGGLLSNLSTNDVGYSAGGGVTYHFSRAAGVRADLRHFKVRKANGLSFQRFTVGIVLGG
jgi:Outer membrane protein beta-barrel domain